MKTDIWLPIYIKDFFSDTMHLSSEDQGFYLLTLVHLWNNGGYLSRNKYKDILKISPKKFDKKMEKIWIFLEKKDEKFYQKRLLKEFRKSKKNRKKASESSIKRWNKQNKDIRSDNPSDMRNASPAPAPAPIINSKTINNKKHPFEKSPLFDKQKFKEYFKDWDSEKCSMYYESAITYSGANGGRYLNWGLAIKGWDRRDQSKPKQQQFKNSAQIQEEEIEKTLKSINHEVINEYQFKLGTSEIRNIKAGNTKNVPRLQSPDNK